MGNPYISANTKLGFGPEASFGVRSPAAISPYAGLKSLGKFSADVSFPDAKMEAKKYYTFGIGRTGWKRVQAGKIDREGKLPIIPEGGDALAYAFGADVVSGAGPYTHDLTPANRAILPSLTLVALMRDDANQRNFQRAFVGTVIEEANFTVSKEEELRCELGILSKSVKDYDLHMDSSDAAHTPINPSFNGFTDTTGRPYMWYDSQVTLGGKRVARVESVEMGIANNHSTKRYLVDAGAGEPFAGREPFEFLTGRPDFEFQMDFVPAGNLETDVGAYNFSTGPDSSVRESIYNLLGTETYVNVSVKLKKPGSPEDSIQFDFLDCLISEANHDWSIEGNEVSVPVTVEPRAMTMRVIDPVDSVAYVA